MNNVEHKLLHAKSVAKAVMELLLEICGNGTGWQALLMAV